MKTHKSTAVRYALTLVAAGSALALTACGAGQISQTADQVAAVNGTAAAEGNVAVRDVSVVVTPDNDVALKFTAANLEDKGSPISLERVTVNGKKVALEGDNTIAPGCNLVADYEDATEKLANAGQTTCNTYLATKLTKTSDIHLGGNAEVKFAFNNGNVDVNASVVAYTPESGEFHRHESGLQDKAEAEANPESGATHSHH